MSERPNDGPRCTLRSTDDDDHQQSAIMCLAAIIIRSDASLFAFCLSLLVLSLAQHRSSDESERARGGGKCCHLLVLMSVVVHQRSY